MGKGEVWVDRKVGRRDDGLPLRSGGGLRDDTGLCPSSKFLGYWKPDYSWGTVEESRLRGTRS